MDFARNLQGVCKERNSFCLNAKAKDLNVALTVSVFVLEF